jgi:hypothetical protein
MEAKHTEGPWKWSANRNRLDGRVDTVLEAGSGSDIFGCTTFEIEHHYDPDVAAANRRLMEAAPEMLAMLKHLSVWLGGDFYCPCEEADCRCKRERQDYRERVDTLLARIEGGGAEGGAK